MRRQQRQHLFPCRVSMASKRRRYSRRPASESSQTSRPSGYFLTAPLQISSYRRLGPFAGCKPGVKACRDGAAAPGHGYSRCHNRSNTRAVAFS
jgi:hypothetical protein